MSEATKKCQMAWNSRKLWNKFDFVKVGCRKENVGYREKISNVERLKKSYGCREKYRVRWKMSMSWKMSDFVEKRSVSWRVERHEKFCVSQENSVYSKKRRKLQKKRSNSRKKNISYKKDVTRKKIYVAAKCRMSQKMYVAENVECREILRFQERGNIFQLTFLSKK